MAEGAVKRNSGEMVSRGLVALTIENGPLDDPRHDVVNIAVLFRSAQKLGLNASALFAEAAELSNNLNLACDAFVPSRGSCRLWRTKSGLWKMTVGGRPGTIKSAIPVFHPKRTSANPYQHPRQGSRGPGRRAGNLRFPVNVNVGGFQRCSTLAIRSRGIIIMGRDGDAAKVYHFRFHLHKFCPTRSRASFNSRAAHSIQVGQSIF
jgi:hypothetical protein